MSKEEEIFEQEEEDLKRLDKALGLDTDSEGEAGSLKIEIEESAPPAPPKEEKPIEISKKTGKPKRQISEKQRQQNLANLAKGRAKGLETRRRRAALKKIEREAKITEEEKRISEHLEKKKARTKKHDELQEEINKLKAQLAEKNKLSTSNDKPKETKEPKEPQEAKETKKPKEPKKPKEKEPQKETIHSQPKPLTNKQLLKLMRNLR